MKLDDLAHRAAADLRRSGEAARFAASSPARTSPIRRIRTAVLVLAAAALAIGLPLSILISRDGDSRPDPASLSGPTDSIMIAGVEYPVGELVDAFSTQQMYLPHLQPDPGFDTANLGDRMVLPLMDPTVSDDRILNGPSIYLGEVGADSAFLTDHAESADEDQERPAGACVWIGDERICSVPDAGPWTFRSGRGTFAMWVGVPDGTAAVVFSDGSGPLGWQVPRSRSVVLSVPSLAVVATALDHDGQGIVSFDLSYPNVPVTVPVLLGATSLTDSGSGFCAVSEELERLSDPFSLPPDQARPVAEEFLTLMIDARNAAPAEIRGQVTDIAQAYIDLFPAFEAAGFDSSKIDEAAIDYLFMSEDERLRALGIDEIPIEQWLLANCSPSE